MTGDGGDKTIAPLLPLGHLSFEGEVRRLMTSFSSDEFKACRILTDVEKNDLLEYIRSSLWEQPGQRVENKLRALAFRQRARRWLNIGEDRNRSVFWSTSPFYAPKFFFLANSIADELKQRDKLYLRLLGWFDKRMALIPRPGRGRHSLKDKLLLEAYLQLARSATLTGIYRRFKPKHAVQKLAVSIDDELQLARNTACGIWDICSREAVSRVLLHAPSEAFRSQLLSLALWPIELGSKKACSRV
jgi:hypothetical protein